jgi:transcription initiation factor TFIID subunit 6
MPPVLTCLLGRRLCEDPASEPHWPLRRSSAEIVAYICHTFGDAYNTLIPRVIRTMAKTISDPEKPMSSHYGAIVGLTAMGPKTIDSILLPMIKPYFESLSPDSMSDNDNTRNIEVGQVRSALLDAAKLWIDANPLAEGDPDYTNLKKKYDLLFELFGSDL